MDAVRGHLLHYCLCPSATSQRSCKPKDEYVASEDRDSQSHPGLLRMGT